MKFSPSSATKLLAFAMPAAVLACILVLLAVHEVPEIGPLPDLLAFVISIAPATLVPLAAFGLACMMMQVTGQNIDNDARSSLVDAAGRGSWGAFRVLVLEVVGWIGFTWLVLWAYLAQL